MYVVTETKGFRGKKVKFGERIYRAQERRWHKLWEVISDRQENKGESSRNLREQKILKCLRGEELEKII